MLNPASSRLIEMQDINPDDVAIKTKTITTSVQQAAPTITTTTTTKKVFGQEGNDGVFGRGSREAAQVMTTGSNFTGAAQGINPYGQYPVGYASRENTTFTVPQVITQGQTVTTNNFAAYNQTPGLLGVPESERVLMASRGFNPSLALHPEGAMYPQENFCCLYNCCPHDLCKCVTCSNLCVRCCGASCFSDSSIGSPVNSCCSSCCNIRGHGMGMEMGMGGMAPQPYSRNQCLFCCPGFGSSNKSCFSCCCPQRQHNLAPWHANINPHGGLRMENAVVSPVVGTVPTPGIGGATTTSIGVGLTHPGIGAQIASGAVHSGFTGPVNPGFGIGGMGPNMMQYPEYQSGGGCCGGDWCGSNFGSGENCCSSCPTLRKCCC